MFSFERLIGPANSTLFLGTALVLYAQTAIAGERGDVEVGQVKPETDCVVLADIKTAHQTWKPRHSLIETPVLYVNTAHAVLHGLNATGSRATNDLVELSALEQAADVWAKVSLVFDDPATSGTVTKDTKTVSFPALNDLTNKLDEIEVTYSRASKLDL